ncbi:MAG TPA: His/Gly/Thr/Pro-type tRNA ligase C-terminal domain-containing protein [Candidatus Paceibacterota bacterium]
MTKNNHNKGSTLKELLKVDESGRIATFYGFLPIESPQITKEDSSAGKDLDSNWRCVEKASIMREFSEVKTNASGKFLPQPLCLFMEHPFPGSSERRKAGRLEYEISILGSNRSVCESLIIQTAKALLEANGWKNLALRINSVGGRESVSDFERKMANFIRKRMDDFPSELRQNLKKDLFYLARSKDEKYKEWRECAPQSVDCLSEQSRLHLKEILEFLETMEIPYVFDSTLLGEIKISTEVVFEIVSEGGEGEVLARGCRMNRLSKRLQLKKEVPAVSVSVSAKAVKNLKTSTIKNTKHNFFLVQFGPEAKQKSFIALEELRKSGVPILHSLAKDKLTNQMYSVEQSSTEYIILIGQKEALENVAVIRHTSTRAQYTVPIKELGEFIKKTAEFKIK